MDVSWLDALADRYLALEHVKLQDGGILLLKTDARITEDDLMQMLKMLRNLLDQDGFKDVKIVVVSHGTDLEIVPEDEMNRLGWHRKPLSRGYQYL